MEDIHECEFKKGKIIQVQVDQNGNCYCGRCFHQLPESQVDKRVFKRK